MLKVLEIHWFFHTRILFPSLTLILTPFFKTSRPLQILSQRKDASALGFAGPEERFVREIPGFEDFGDKRFWFNENSPCLLC